MGSRRQSRELALQVIFQSDFVDVWENENLQFCLDHFGTNESVVSYASSLCKGVVSNKANIDEIITVASQRWSLTRMARVDRSIIRLATFEIAMLPEVPARVAINEAIEIAKRFGTEDSPLFVNGVLDKIASNLNDDPSAQAA